MITKEEALKDLGLTDKETTVYLSLLMLGQSTVTAIAKKAQLNRVTTYDILESLKNKGYVSHVIISGIMFLEAADPSKFIDELKEKQEKLKQILPEMQSLKASLPKKPNIELYEELNGLKSIFNDILKENKETWFIGASQMIGKLKFYFPHFITQKRKQKMFSKVITTDCSSMRKYKRKAPAEFISMRFIPDKIDVTKIIYSNKLAYLTFKEKDSIGILVENKNIADQERLLFELMWKGAIS